MLIQYTHGTRASTSHYVVLQIITSGLACREFLRPPQLAVIAAQLREAKTSKEEALFDMFIKAEVSTSL